MDNTEFEHKVRKEVEQIFNYDSFTRLNQSEVLDGFDYNSSKSVINNIREIIIVYGKKTGKKLQFSQ